MKKEYGKPRISFENFAFSSNIAGNCENVNGIHARGTCNSYGTLYSPSDCEFFDNGFVIFYDSCMMAPQENDIGNLCYHVSTAETKLFAS